jgi:hypothetical protein
MGYIMDDAQNQKVLKENYSDAIKRRLYPQDMVPAKGQKQMNDKDALMGVIRKRRQSRFGYNSGV